MVTVDDHRGRPGIRRKREEGLSFYTPSFDALGRERRKQEKKKKCGNKAKKGTNERIVRTDGCAAGSRERRKVVVI